MHKAVLCAVFLLMGATVAAQSLEDLNSPGPSPDPIRAQGADYAAYSAVTEEMVARWLPYDAACDPKAIFGMLYLVTTAKVGDLVPERHFDDNPFLVEWDAEFAGRYFAALDSWAAGETTPGPWAEAFAYGESGTSTLTEDLLLGMNAHVNYDLAFSAYAMGLVADGKKDEFDRVNDGFWRVLGPVNYELGHRYSGTNPDPEAELSDADRATVELLISWREGAWQHATALTLAPGALARAVVAAEIEATTTAAARLLQGDNGDTRAARQATCVPGLPVVAHHGGPGYVPGIEAGPMVICHEEEVWIDHKHPGKAHVNEAHQRHSTLTHQATTITIDPGEWASHAAHGDYKGSC